jgi:hypothetical protein
MAPRVAPGKQPSAPTGGTVNLERDLGEGFGERKSAPAESDRDRFRLGVDVAGGESGDAGDGLGVEQDEASRETVSRVKRGVRQQAAQNLYALQVGKRDGLTRGLRIGDVQLTTGTVAFEPNDEQAHPAPP